jgi:antitoxin VapB
MPAISYIVWETSHTGSGAMSITISNREAERLMAEIEQATGRNASQIVLDLLRAEANRLRTRRVRNADEAEARMERLHRELAALPVRDPRSPDEILGYDEHGLPR